MNQLKIKTLRRVETEIEKEITVQTGRFRSNLSGFERTQEEAESAGIGKTTIQYDLVLRLLSFKFEIRGLIGKFNTDKGINERTLEMAKLKDLIAVLEGNIIPLSSCSRHYSYNHKDEEGFDLGITNEYRDSIRVEVRKITQKIQSLKDSCAGINNSGLVTLSDELYTYLSENEFI